MKKWMKILCLIVIFTLSLTYAAFAAETKYYISGNMNGYTNPDENYLMTKNENGIYTLTKSITKVPATPSGTDLATYAYKVTNGTWNADGCWGADFYTNKAYKFKTTDGMGSILFNIDKDQEITFYFNPELMLLADTTYYKMVEPYIVGDFFSEMGIGDDWAADKATTKLIDPDFDNIYTGKFKIPAGKYAFKTTIGKTWDESYGKDGATVGMNTNMDLVVEKEGEVEFTFDYNTKITTIKLAEKPAEPSATPSAAPSETASSATPEATPASTPEATPSSTPEATPASTPETTPSSTPEATPTPVPASSEVDTAQNSGTSSTILFIVIAAVIVVGAAAYFIISKKKKA